MRSSAILVKLRNASVSYQGCSSVSVMRSSAILVKQNNRGGISRGERVSVMRSSAILVKPCRPCGAGLPAWFQL